MNVCEIQSFHVRYRLPRRNDAERRRLDSLLHSRLDELLERAIARGGITPQEQICIRHLFVPLRVRMFSTDQSIIETWSEALAERIRDAIDSGLARDDRGNLFEVVRYTSRPQAMIDLAIGVSRGDSSRAWAWRQLGLWQRGTRVSQSEALDELLRTLMREPAMILPVFRALADRELFHAFTRRLSANEWTILAAAAADRAGSTLNSDDLRPTRHGSSAPSSPEMARLAERLVRAASLIAAWESDSIRVPDRVLAVWVILEADPILMSRPRERLLKIMSAVEHVLRSRADGHAQSVAERVGERMPAETDDHGQTKAFLERAPQMPKTRNDDTGLPELRRRAHTAQGGLLFLLRVLADLGKPAQIPDIFPARSVRWVLHKLALELVPAVPEDPAALAFAGLPPHSPPPDRDEAPATPREHNLLGHFADEVRGEVMCRLKHLELTSQSLLAFVCERQAEIVADPGWIEAHFSLDSVSTDIRRAALDIDPGYLPWLGVVVKFVYE